MQYTRYQILDTEFADRRDVRADERMNIDGGGVQDGEQGVEDIDREGSEDGEGEREGNGAEESGAEVGEGGKGKKRKTRKMFKRVQWRAGLGQKGEGVHAQAETAAGAEGETYEARLIEKLPNSRPVFS